MAPEVLRGDPADARADQFSFGVLLYELVTGRHPFRGTDDTATVTRIIETEPPAIEPSRPDCPQALVRATGIPSPTPWWRTSRRRAARPCHRQSRSRSGRP